MKTQYKIGEIAKIFDISTDSLRFYEKEGLLVAKRDQNSYRVYSIFDIWKLNIIQTMKSLGISLGEIRNFLNNRSVANEKALLEKELSYIDKKISTLVYQKAQLINRLEILDDALVNNAYDEVITKNLGARKVIYIEDRFVDDNQVDLAYSTLIKNSKDPINFFNRDFGMILPKEKIAQKRYNEYQRAFLILDKDEEIYDDIIPPGLYAIIRFRGAYENIKVAYQKLDCFINENKFIAGSYAIERYLIDINQTSTSEEYVTEIQIKIEKAKKA